MAISFWVEEGLGHPFLLLRVCSAIGIKAYWKSNKGAWDCVLHEVMHHFWQMSMEMQIHSVKPDLMFSWPPNYRVSQQVGVKSHERIHQKLAGHTVVDNMRFLLHMRAIVGCKVPSYLLLLWPIWQQGQQVEKTGRQQITRLLTTPLTAPDTDSISLLPTLLVAWDIRQMTTKDLPRQINSFKMPKELRGEEGGPKSKSDQSF